MSLAVVLAIASLVCIFIGGYLLGRESAQLSCRDLQEYLYRCRMQRYDEMENIRSIEWARYYRTLELIAHSTCQGQGGECDCPACTAKKSLDPTG
jgi:hypothetical protein